MACRIVIACWKCGSQSELCDLKLAPLSFLSSLTISKKRSKLGGIFETVAHPLATALDRAGVSVSITLCERCVCQALTQQVVTSGNLSSSILRTKRSERSKGKSKSMDSLGDCQEPRLDSIGQDGITTVESLCEKYPVQSSLPPSPFPSETS